MWGSDSTNSRGRQIEQFISNNSLCLLNNDETTYFHEPLAPSTSLDLAILSPQHAFVARFHCGVVSIIVITFRLSLSFFDRGGATRPPPVICSASRLGMLSRKWQTSPILWSVLPISRKQFKMSSTAIMYAATNYNPKRVPQVYENFRPWWNEACRDSNREQKRRWNIFRRCPTTDNLIAFLSVPEPLLVAFAESVVKGEFASSLQYVLCQANYYGKVKAANGIYEEFSFPVLNTGNVVVSSPLEVANTLRCIRASVTADSYSSAFVAIKNRAERKSLHFSTQKILSLQF
ncbi:hypothetical protein AVEN_23039-1 [Araneus ventricosus]|uniref:Uncharacterized protein n=1 Tax=Araneus ventricosus TaxID=182803 RepID=A0A4Y2LKC9_ARAVE|nr:hypothetical protein AVEN_23039-1 [Araneus ventricosus]